VALLADELGARSIQGEQRGGLSDRSYMKGLLLVGLASLAFGSRASAQDDATTRVRIGVGAKSAPEFPGAASSQLGPLIDLSIANGAEPFRFEAPDDSFDIRLIRKAKFSAGPVLALQGSRKNSDLGAKVGKVPMTIEAGTFVELQATKALRLRGEVRHGVGGHKGLISSVGADYIWRDGDKYVVSIGPRLLIADRNYRQAYFGMSTQAALATGLPVYRAAGGLHSAAATSGISYSIDGYWGLFGFARYERLISVRESPILRSYGSPNQYSGGLGLTYSFTIQK